MFRNSNGKFPLSNTIKSTLAMFFLLFRNHLYQTNPLPTAEDQTCRAGLLYWSHSGTHIAVSVPDYSQSM